LNEVLRTLDRVSEARLKASLTGLKDSSSAGNKVYRFPRFAAYQQRGLAAADTVVRRHPWHPAFVHGLAWLAKPQGRSGARCATGAVTRLFREALHHSSQYVVVHVTPEGVQEELKKLD